MSVPSQEKFGQGTATVKGGASIPELEAVLHAVRDERIRQEVLKAEGRFNHTPADFSMTAAERLATIAEEVGEVARHVLQEEHLTHDGVSNDGDLDKELVQVAALAVAWLEGRAVRRRLYGGPELHPLGLPR